MTTLFTSDLHFFHRKITEFTERNKFTTAENHTEWLIDIWNSQVQKSDVVYHLGDFSFSHKQDEVFNVVKQLNGQKFFIKGNHDDRKILDMLQKDSLIVKWEDYMEVKVKGQEQKTCLFHFPIASWNGQRYASWHLHGHSHGGYEGKGKILDVGIDSAYKILGEHRFFTEEDVLEYMNHQEIHIVDNHRKG